MKRLTIVLLAVLAGSLAHADSSGRRDSAINSTLNLIGPRTPVRSNMEMWVVGQGGLSQMTSNFDKSVELKNHDVYGGGFLVEAGRFSFTGQMGVMYFEEGMNATQAASPASGATSGIAQMLGDLDYVGIPLVGRWNPIRRGRTRLSMGLGLMPSFFVSSHMKYHEELVDSKGATQVSDGDVGELSGIRKTNVMALASIGGDLGLGRSQDMRIEVVYRRGLMPFTENNDSGAYTNSVVMNLGFGFDI